nr:phosphatidylinositol-specific phospholipase C domain-containing protein [uncultured Dysosmobacter sp.]
MKKRIICLLLCAAMLLPSLTAPVSAAPADETAQTPASEAANYLQQGDYFVISPAEKWQAFLDLSKPGLNVKIKRVAVATTEWELTAQHSGTANGNDIQTWKYGVSDKFYVERHEVRGSDGAGCFRIQNKSFRESDNGRYWDIENRNLNPGGNVHVWDFKKGTLSQWFYLEEDGDGDPETFFLKNRNSDLYIVPRHYFKDPEKDCGPGKASWSEEGCNLEQSEFSFRWRIQVLNRDAANDMGKTDKYANWMSLLPDDRYLSELNIPGTHDSATANVEGSWNASYNKVACQKYFIEQQLYAGVRALDLRTRWHGNDMVMVHGDFICHTPDHNNRSKNKTFRSVLDTVIRYLKAHPTETVIATLKIDSGDKDKGRLALVNILNEYTERYPDRFYCWTGTAYPDTLAGTQGRMTSPTLGQARGKIVLMTRVDMSGAGESSLYSYTGPDLTQWDDSYKDRNHYAQKIESPSKVSVYIQDDYSSPDDNKKRQVFNTVYQLNGTYTLPGASKIEKKDFVFNYTSKTGSDRYGSTPLGAAKYMNDLIYNDDLFTPGSDEAKRNPRLGIVVMDFVNKQLCRRIIDRNAFPSSAAMKVGTVTADGETQTVEQTPFLSAFAEMSLSDGLTATAAPTENVAASPSSEENAPAPTEGMTVPPAPTEGTPAPTEGVTAPPSFEENAPAPTENVTVPTEDVLAPLSPVENVTAPPSPTVSEEIVWPEKAELTYGYVLGEAALRFADGASGGKAGRFEFENAAEILPATTTGEEPEKQTLKFLPADGSDGETKEIPVTVRRRYLPIKISNFEVEYGDDFSRDALTRDVAVTAGGYLLPEHLAHLNEIIQQYEIQWLLRDGEGNEIPWPETPATDNLASGTIDLRASVGITPETEFPNYNARVERGVWKIVPRTVTVSWRWDNGAWHAELGNVLPGDDVAPVLTDGTLTLTGEQAAYYQVADEDQTAPPIPSAPSEKSDRTPSEHQLRTVEAAHGNVTVSKNRMSPGEAVTLSVTPDNGYVLETLVVTDALGKTLSLTPLGKGRYSFIMPDSEVTIKAAFLNAADVPVFFADVSADDYYYDAVLWAVRLGITTGTDDAHFSPNADCARGQLVTFLWRAAGKPKAEQAALFSDVGTDAYYAEAVRWAAALGIVTGYDDGRFGAGDPITRQQMAVMLYRFAKALGMETAQSGAGAQGFDDFEQVSAYAEEAITWAVNAAILRGAGNRLMPQAPCTRAQMVTMLNRLLGE